MAETNHGSNTQSHGHGSLKSYVIGFLLSIVLTIIPLVVVLGGMVEKTAATVIILAMAVLQFAVQLVFFMHLREGEDSKWNMTALVLGLVIVLMVVVGSIWIMMYNQVFS